MQFNSIIDVETRDPNWTKWRTGFILVMKEHVLSGMLKKISSK